MNNLFDAVNHLRARIKMLDENQYASVHDFYVSKAKAAAGTVSYLTAYNF